MAWVWWGLGEAAQEDGQLGFVFARGVVNGGLHELGQLFAHCLLVLLCVFDAHEHFGGFFPGLYA